MSLDNNYIEWASCQPDSNQKTVTRKQKEGNMTKTTTETYIWDMNNEKWIPESKRVVTEETDTPKLDWREYDPWTWPKDMNQHEDKGGYVWTCEGTDASKQV